MTAVVGIIDAFSYYDVSQGWRDSCAIGAGLQRLTTQERPPMGTKPPCTLRCRHTVAAWQMHQKPTGVDASSMAE